MKKEQNTTMKVERISELSEFEKAQTAIIQVGQKIRQHQRLQKNINDLTGFEVDDNLDASNQEITIYDKSRNRFNISEPVLIREVIDFVIQSAREKSKVLEAEIVRQSKQISEEKAA